ncbi:MAG: hypothetical protein VZR02_05505 [Lachnospiraceae bacterium]|nr:hypothetical protein [Lachnospiraceae bacterium]
MKKYEFLTRASYTVELALLMPVLIGTILAVIYLDDHVHNCATLTANACEAAVTGHDDAEIPSYVAMGHVDRSMSDGKNARTVIFSSVTYDADDRVFGEVRGEGTYKKIHAVSILRKAKGLTNLLGS